MDSSSHQLTRDLRDMHWLLVAIAAMVAYLVYRFSPWAVRAEELELVCPTSDKTFAVLLTPEPDSVAPQCCLCQKPFPRDDDEAFVDQVRPWSMISFGNERTPLLACCDLHMETYLMQGLGH